MTLERLSRLRQGVYRLFGAGFSYPTAEMIAAGGAALPIFEDLGMFDYAFAPDVARAAHELGAANLDELSVAHVALFDAGTSGPACPPYESAYRADARSGEAAGLQAELKRTILRLGLRLEDSANDMVDHVSTEMHVMAMLCSREAERHIASAPFARVVSSQLEFLQNHLLRWVPTFSSVVEGSARHPAYAAVAAGTRAFLDHERQLAPLLVAEAKEET